MSSYRWNAWTLRVDLVQPFASCKGQSKVLLRSSHIEILGNLIDNASKWASREVLVSASHTSVKGDDRSGLLITIEDDGPGIPENEIQTLLRRGGRSVSPKSGQGIGLAVAREIVEDLYHARLTLKKSALGGACVVLGFDNSSGLDM